MISKYTKMVPKTYYTIDDIEFDSGDLFYVLDKLASTGIGDALNDYDLPYECADKLVELGYLVRTYGSHQAILYHDTKDKKAEELLKELISL